MADAETRIGGRYRLVRQLAAGGMGTVWEGWDERLHRTVAIKRLQLQPGLSESDAEIASQRVMREARLTARLHHPNAVQVFDVVDDNNHPCLVMQYVPSRSLQQLVRADGPLEPAAVARIGTQIAAALAAAHRAGIVHRDVKPANVLIAEDGTAKITDFGISHAVDDVTLTSTGLVTGTPAYLAPEVARGHESNFASDVYSLGATLYMAVEGDPPAGTDSNPMAMLHRVASGNTNPPVRSGALTAPLMAMLGGNPELRPSMVDIATRLTDVRSGAPVADVTRAITRDPTPPPPGHLPAEFSPRTMSLETTPVQPRPPLVPAATAPQDERPRALWPIIAAAVLVIVLGIVLGIVLLSGNSGNGTSASGPSTAPTTKHTTSHSPTTSHSSTPPARTSSGPTKSAPAAAPSASDLAQAVTEYYDLVPANLSAGWSRLTRHFQTTKASNRATYDRYWNSISRVDVTNAVGQPPSTAVATLVYHLKSGGTSTERTQFTFVRRDGVLKIDATNVIG